MKSYEAWQREYYNRPLCCVCHDRIANRAFKHCDEELYAHSACVDKLERHGGNFYPLKRPKKK